MKRDNLTVVLGKFARELNTYIDLQKVYDELLIHPDYPSLLAVSDVLQNFNIPNAAYKVDPAELKNIPTPFIAHVRLNRGEFMLVHDINDDTVRVSNQKWNRHKMSLGDFERIFNGIVLAADTEELPKQTPVMRRNTLSNMKRIGAITLLAALFAYTVVFNTSFLSGLSWQVAMLTLVKTAGIAVSVLLLIQSLDSGNPLVQKLCQAGGKNTCSDILSSKAAKVFEGLSWSEVGFFYFSSTWLFLLFGGTSVSNMQLLALLNFACLPYTVYSVYYQLRIAKKWCVLCCNVQALLWLEFASVITLFHLPLQSVSAVQVGSLLAAILLPVSLWILARPLILKLQQVDPLKGQLQQFKYNSELFEQSLLSQPKFVQPDDEWSIVLGNAEAENVITMVSNPYCPPCAKAHKALHELLNKRPDIQARIVFTATNSDDDIKTPVSRHMMTLNGLPDKSIVKKALYDWYEQKQKSYETWAKAYPAELNETEYNKINKQNDWCTLAEISATPTTLINGYKLPPSYQLTDLKYMLL